MKYQKIITTLFTLLLLASCGRGSDDAPTPTPQVTDSVEGVLFFPASIKGVRMQVNDIEVLSAEGDGRVGFAYVVVNVSFFNESEAPIVPETLVLVDDFQNIYITQKNSQIPFSDQLSPMPLTIGRNTEMTGEQAFLVPITALQSELKLRWESLTHNSRIDIFLGSLDIAGE